MLGKIRHVLRDPLPIRLIASRWLDRRLNLFTYTTKLDLGSIERPYYGHGLLQAATLAAKLGHKAISAIEFGVAGGNGLVNLEMHVEHIKRETGVEVAIYGFDTGGGMSPPVGHRDMPYMWQAGYFAMNQDKLRARLRSAKLAIGRVEETLKTFCQEEKPPIGSAPATAMVEGRRDWIAPGRSRSTLRLRPRPYSAAEVARNQS